MDITENCRNIFRFGLKQTIWCFNEVFITRKLKHNKIMNSVIDNMFVIIDKSIVKIDAINSYVSDKNIFEVILHCKI